MTPWVKRVLVTNVVVFLVVQQGTLLYALLTLATIHLIRGFNWRYEI